MHVAVHFIYLKVEMGCFPQIYPTYGPAIASPERAKSTPGMKKNGT
jgi:hypothetical protein